jgi:(p)ppGpp synthase/HD superfamily hydrolase
VNIETVEFEFPGITLERRDYLAMCLELCKKFHAGQTRRGTGEPYHNHPIRVANAVDDELKPAALLHDVVEDCEVTIEDLIGLGVNERDLAFVGCLTHWKWQSYLQYLLVVMERESTIKIKIADIRDNMVGATGTLKDKYDLALYILESAK